MEFGNLQNGHEPRHGTPMSFQLMPALVTPQGNAARTISEKPEALRERFYPIVEADLSDIDDTSFSEGSFSQNPIEVSQKATREEVESLLKSQKPFRAPGIDGVPNGYLRAVGP